MCRYIPRNRDMLDGTVQMELKAQLKRSGNAVAVSVHDLFQFAGASSAFTSGKQNFMITSGS